MIASSGRDAPSLRAIFNWRVELETTGEGDEVNPTPDRLIAAPSPTATASSGSSAPVGMATVYLAQDLKHDRKVAIKVLRPELAAVIGAERFLERDQDHRQSRSIRTSCRCTTPVRPTASSST